MRYLLFALLVAGCHPREGDYYRAPGASGRLHVTQTGRCDDLETISNSIMRQIAEAGGHAWEPVAYGFEPSADCVAFWVQDVPGSFKHVVMTRPEFLTRFERVPASSPPAP